MILVDRDREHLCVAILLAQQRDPDRLVIEPEHIQRARVQVSGDRLIGVVGQSQQGPESIAPWSDHHADRERRRCPSEVACEEHAVRVVGLCVIVRGGGRCIQRDPPEPCLLICRDAAWIARGRLQKRHVDSEIPHQQETQAIDRAWAESPTDNVRTAQPRVELGCAASVIESYDIVVREKADALVFLDDEKAPAALGGLPRPVVREPVLAEVLVGRYRLVRERRRPQHLLDDTRRGHPAIHLRAVIEARSSQPHRASAVGGKAPESLLFGAKDLQDGIQPRHAQHLARIRRRLSQLELAALLPHRRVTGDEFGNSLRVDKRDILGSIRVSQP